MSLTLTMSKENKLKPTTESQEPRSGKIWGEEDCQAICWQNYQLQKWRSRSSICKGNRWFYVGLHFRDDSSTSNHEQKKIIILVWVK